MSRLVSLEKDPRAASRTEKPSDCPRQSGGRDAEDWSRGPESTQTSRWTCAVLSVEAPFPLPCGQASVSSPFINIDPAQQTDITKLLPETKTPRFYSRRRAPADEESPMKSLESLDVPINSAGTGCSQVIVLDSWKREKKAMEGRVSRPAKSQNVDQPWQRSNHHVLAARFRTVDLCQRPESVLCQGLWCSASRGQLGASSPAATRFQGRWAGQARLGGCDPSSVAHMVQLQASLAQMGFMDRSPSIARLVLNAQSTALAPCADTPFKHVGQSNQAEFKSIQVVFSYQTVNGPLMHPFIDSRPVLLALPQHQLSSFDSMPTRPNSLPPSSPHAYLSLLSHASRYSAHPLSPFTHSFI
ncbi:hypothetical protein BGZ61DRAFT_475985 [Ilyonectria robusta]|uniref:uncharacterized protein n=1 Tax=Ilyonectria robusta TaxID=1079257 RepID=UPI001E8EC20E|nr:uncharacterized protein BGZ61DRAFT_475985 [Ilyonectria robusta]KAH8722077.1 hypothetical protein BGZ61DRAFT_475985 [Ilyonectria robusta]